MRSNWVHFRTRRMAYSVPVAVNQSSNIQTTVSTQSTSIKPLSCLPSSAPAMDALAWHGIECHVSDSSKNQREITVLRGISGYASSGDLVAILGPSGAGKTTLLDILTRRKTAGRVEGLVTFNGAAVTGAQDLRPYATYVMQEETFHATSTAMETIMFQAHMRLPRYVPMEVKRELAQRLLEAAGLQGKADVRIGGKLPGGMNMPGLSGGEKRRVSLCCGVVAKPKVLFCDEITSGLDSIAALKVIIMLRRFCTEGMIVLCTMHQPRSEIWRLVDNALVLSKGHQLFFGTPKAAEEWFTEGLGLIMPPETTPVDFIVDQVNVDFDKSGIYGEEFEARHQGRRLATIEDIAEAAATFRLEHPRVFLKPDVISTSPHSMHLPSKNMVESMRDWYFKFRILLERNLQAYVRNPSNVMLRFVMYQAAAMVNYTSLSKVGQSKGLMGFHVIVGSIFYSLLAQAMFPYLSMPLFASIRAFYTVENAGGLYPPSCYYLSIVLIELVLNSVNGCISAILRYTGNNYYTFFAPERPLSAFAGFVGFMTLMNATTNAQVAFFTFTFSNQETAFMTSAAFNLLALLATGALVPFSAMSNRVKLVSHASHVKHVLAGVLYHFFNDCHRNVTPLFGTPHRAMRALGLDAFVSPGANALMCLAIYLCYTIGGYLALKHLHRERR